MKHRAQDQTSRLPAAAPLSKKIQATKADRKHTLADSTAFLLNRRASLQSYASVEDLVLASDSEKVGLGGVEYHLVALRRGLVKELWPRQIVVGVSVIDELLLRALRDGAVDPVRRVLELISSYQMHKAGFMIFPVHSFGILGAGFFHWKSTARLEFISQEFGFALSAQTNELDKTISFMDRLRHHFGIGKKIPKDLVEHWSRTRPAEWLTRNPLLAVRVQSFPGGYYENEFLVISALKMAAASVSFLAALQESVDEKQLELWSSSVVNSVQTLDIRHYMIFFNSLNPRHPLAGHCVPIHLSRPALAEISNLGIELDPKYWMRRRAVAVSMLDAVRRVHAGFLRSNFGDARNSIRGRVYHKLWTSLAYFRRSFHRSDQDWSGTLGLAVAFEMLVTDRYASRTNERVVRRVKLLLRGVAGVRKLSQAVDELYKARGSIVHTGATTQVVSFQIARRAFALSFTSLVSRLPKLRESMTEPMKALTGDCKD